MHRIRLAHRMRAWHTVRMQHRVHTTPDGLTVLTIQESAHPVVSVQLWVGTGSADESGFAGCGISHLLEHMVFKGTEEYTAAQLNENVSAAGGMWNAYTSTDRTVYHIDGPSANWRQFLHILLQLVFCPTFPEDEFEREREVIRREMAMYRDDPQDVAYKALIETLFRAHPRRLPIIGIPERFDTVTRDDMARYHREHYVPGNMFLCIAGDIDHEEVSRAADDETARFPHRDMPIKSKLYEPRQWGNRLHRQEFQQPTSTLMLAWRIPHAAHPDAAPLTLLCSILGDGRSAALYRHFHDELGIAHDISVMPIPTKEGEGEGAFVIEADTDRAKRDTLRDAIAEYVRLLPEQDFEEGRRRVCRQLTAKRLHQLGSAQGIASVYGISWHLSRNPDSMHEWEEALNRVSADDIARVAGMYLTPERVTEVSIDPVGSNERQLSEAAGNDILPAEEHTLSNGLRVVTRVDRRIPQVYATLAFRAGCPSETEKSAGINSLMAECMLKGSTNRTAAQLADTMENMGGSISSETGNNTMLLHAQVLREDAETMLELLADAALTPIFPDEAVETEKEALAADIADQEEDPAAVAFRRLRRLCFGTVSYGNHPDGTEESVQALDRTALCAHHRRIVRSGNAVLCITGDMDVPAVLEAAERYFGLMPQGNAPGFAATPQQQAGNARFFTDREQAVIALALPGVCATSPELPVQLLVDEWCRDTAGPIFTELREKRALAYYASSASLLGVDAGCLYFYLGTEKSRIDEAVGVLQQVLAELTQQGMPDEAFERTKATVLAARLLSRQSSRKMCSVMAVDTLLGAGWDYSEKLPELLRSITPEQVREFMKRVLAPQGTHTWCIIEPAEA